MTNKIALYETADGRVFKNQVEADKAERASMLLHEMEEKQEHSDPNMVFFIGTMEALEPSLEDPNYIPNLLDGYKRLYNKYFGPHAIAQKFVSAQLDKIATDEGKALAEVEAAKILKNKEWNNQSKMLDELYGSDADPLLDDM